MTRLIHARGDVTGMFLFLLFFLLGLWQVVVARKRLNGMSLTGHPDRKWLSYAAGAAIIAGSCAWYFSGRNHFASPDLEGIETLVVLLFALVCSTILQGIAAQLVGLVRGAFEMRGKAAGQGGPDGARELEFEACGDTVPAVYLDASPEGERRMPILLLHDYGGSKQDVAALGEFLAKRGYPSLALDLDGHGASLREVVDPAMEDLLDGASRALKSEAGSDALAVVGIGLGGTLALGLATSGRAVRAVAIDPPARDKEGHHDISALREFSPASIMSGLVRPGARAGGGRRLGLSKLLATIPETVKAEHKGHSTVIGTRSTWLNEPGALTDYGSKYSPFAPVLIKGSHASLALEKGTLEFLAGTID